MNAKEKLLEYMEEFKKIPAGVFIDNPEEKISIGDFSISRRALKHFVESRLGQNADIIAALDNLYEVVERPGVVINNPDQKYEGSLLMGKPIQNDTKALMVVIDINKEIVSIHYKKIKQFNKIKDQISAGGEAASGT